MFVGTIGVVPKKQSSRVNSTLTLNPSNAFAPQAGEITVPPKQSSSLFYISQRPYLVSGSLRDQLLYPHPPAAVWEAASPAERARFQHFPHAHLAPEALEERLCGALEAVELDYLLGRCGSY